MPEFVDGKALQSYLSEDGQLTMEAPVLMDRVYQNSIPSAITSSSSSFHQSGPGCVVDTTFSSGNLRQPASYSTSSSSSFRQETNNGATATPTVNHHQHSPLRDQYSSTSSTSTVINNQPAAVTFSTITARPENTIADRTDGMKNVTYKFNLSEFAPEDIAIQVNDSLLKVSALRQERDGHSTSHREFKREIGRLR